MCDWFEFTSCRRTVPTLTWYSYKVIFIPVSYWSPIYWKQNKKRYFKRILTFFSSLPFYNTYVRLPTREAPIPQKIVADPHFQYFRDCIGAVDGTHIHVFAPFDKHVYMCNQKGFLLQNCLFVCDFDFCFTYMMTGWDGATSDVTLWHDTHSHDLRMPEGCYLLGDARFGSSDALLVPYRGVRYHLKEWRQASLQYSSVLICQVKII